MAANRVSNLVLEMGRNCGYHHRPETTVIENNDGAAGNGYLCGGIT